MGAGVQRGANSGAVNTSVFRDCVSEPGVPVCNNGADSWSRPRIALYNFTIFISPSTERFCVNYSVTKCVPGGRVAVSVLGDPESETNDVVLAYVDCEGSGSQIGRRGRKSYRSTPLIR